MVDAPLPGSPVRGSKTGSPIMALFDLLGRRWAMGILWVLNTQGPCTFRSLQAACDNISPSVLNTRISELKKAGLVEKSESGYVSTQIGQSIYGALQPLSAVSKDWAASLSDNKPSE